jgi:hypothetical protein
MWLEDTYKKKENEYTFLRDDNNRVATAENMPAQ